MKEKNKVQSKEKNFSILKLFIIFVISISVLVFSSTLKKNVVFADSGFDSSYDGGGAIYNKGTLTINKDAGTETVFEGNGIKDYNSTDHSGTVRTTLGGAIYNDASGKTNTINKARFEYNRMQQQKDVFSTESEKSAFMEEILWGLFHY